MKYALLVLSLLLTAHVAQAEGRTAELNGLSLSAKSTCASLSEQTLLRLLSERLQSMPYPVIPPNQRGMRLHADLHCNPYENTGGTVLYTGEIALEVLARVDRPFSDHYWMPIYDYKIYGIKADSELNAAFATGVDEFIASMSQITRRAYQGFGLQPPL